MTPDAWSVQLAKTWIGKDRVRRRMADKVADLMRSHRAVSGLSVDGIHAELLFLGQAGHWYMCTTAITLCGELLLCAKHGGTFATYSGQWPADEQDAVTTIRYLRNAMCHPAHVTKSDGPPARLMLAHHLAAKAVADQADAARLRSNGVLLAAPWLSRVALAQIGVVGEAFCRQHRLLNA